MDIYIAREAAGFDEQIDILMRVGALPLAGAVVWLSLVVLIDWYGKREPRRRKMLDCETKEQLRFRRMSTRQKRTAWLTMNPEQREAFGRQLDPVASAEWRSIGVDEVYRANWRPVS